MYEHGDKAFKNALTITGMTGERAQEIANAAMAEYRTEKRKSRKLSIRVAKGEDEDKVRAELERKYPRQEMPAGSQPATGLTAGQLNDPNHPAMQRGADDLRERGWDGKPQRDTSGTYSNIQGFVPLNKEESTKHPFVAGTARGFDKSSGKQVSGVPIITDIRALQSLKPGSLFMSEDGVVFRVPARRQEEVIQEPEFDQPA